MKPHKIMPPFKIKNQMIALNKPYFWGNEINYIKQTIDSGCHQPLKLLLQNPHFTVCSML
jgi:hypothetical protein